jgi:ABC-type lipoprotein release transport system permease subunit
MNLTIAWRNIWRNKKRTLITITSVSFAVVMAVFTRSFQEGSYAKMIENAVGQFSGYVQVHQKDYWNDKTLDNGIVLNDSLINTILSVPDVEGVNLRLESFSLASYGKNTKGSMIMGIEPEVEDKMIGLRSKMIKGSYFSKEDKSILIGSKLASYLGITVGDTIVLLGQGHWGQSAIGAYPVKGIVKIPSPEIDKQIIFMPLALAQEFFSFENGVSSIVVKFQDATKTKKITKLINKKLINSDFSAIGWREMMPEMVQIIQSDRAGGIFMIAVLYMIIAFGVFGTVLMMTEERKKEFAVMVSIGTQRAKLMMISIYETLLINSLAIVLGVIITIPIIIYYSHHPIRMTGESAKSIEKLGIEPVMPTLMDASIFLHQIEVILIIVAVASIYPLISIARFNLIKSLRR